jgi:hypothetical protein
MDMTDADYGRSRAQLPRRVRAGALWFGILCGPIAALANEEIEYAMESWSCGRFDSVSHITLHLVPIILIALCVVAGLVAWNGRTEPVDASDEHAVDADWSRRGFMSLLGVGLSVMGILVIIAEWIPVWYLNPCTYL